MDIGTAKPDFETLQRVPHRLIDIRDPEESYSAGDFVRDARAEMADILDHGRLPLLVGGTMMYFRALTKGIAELPGADAATRREIDAMAADNGWPAVHAELETVDPKAASRINPNDGQRLQRALEVYRLSGKTLTQWQDEARGSSDDVTYLKVALQIEPRNLLHERIELRLNQMVENGLIEELRGLRERPGLTQRCSSMRSVGYRQFWDFLEHRCTLDQAKKKALFATRQLAKRQFTWLRSEESVFAVNPLEAGAIDTISQHVVDHLGS
jgi:tRNA dimethylallyltransferase